jgi:protein-S-isoprenylcysteine O-methyltransferase Ste14
MLGFLLQWPTIPTMVMFPVLVWMYVRLAKAEERQIQTEFGEAYTNYARRIPAFIPHLGLRRLTE